MLGMKDIQRSEMATKKQNMWMDHTKKGFEACRSPEAKLGKLSSPCLIYATERQDFPTNTYK